MNHKIILLVDDEFILLESLRIQLGNILPNHILLESAMSGEEAIQLIDEFELAKQELLLVVCDFHLTDMKGTDILKHALKKYPEIRKIILSGQSNAEQIEDFKNEFPKTTVLDKPWNFEKIKAVVDEIL
ncbi:MAG: response regulator [Bacteroidota bacterium]|jgi:DNA-binding NtrC family response regulator